MLERDAVNVLQDNSGVAVVIESAGFRKSRPRRWINERQLKLAFLPVQQHAIGLGAQKFADLVGEKSGGKIKVKLFPGGALGGDLQALSALQGGTIEMTILVTSNLVGIIKDFVLLDFPFLFNNEKEADTVLDGPVGKKLLDKLPEKGLVGLDYYEFGFRQFSNSKRPITRAEDLQGLKIRVTQNPLFVDFINAVGANAVPLAIPELYGAMEQKAVDGIDSPLSFIQLQKYYEVQKHVALTRHLYNAQIVLISKKTWDRLSADECKALQDAANESRDYQRKMLREQDAKALESLKQAGMQVTEVPLAEIAKMRDKAKPVVDKYSKEEGDTLVKEMIMRRAVRSPAESQYLFIGPVS
jgi:tripartite ATP-independent transporter DctP family solute receptor